MIEPYRLAGKRNEDIILSWRVWFPGLTVSLATAISTASAPASARAAADARVSDGSDNIEAVVVTGTRAPDRTALTSAVPVEVITSESLQNTGYADLARALEFTEPAVNFPRAQSTPTSANTRAITIRGLSPDEVLVLVNGKRWHASAVINTNFAVGRGSAPFDLSQIPIVAVDHIEVLRDGAAAQYGSDAIAGVINIILKSNASGGQVSLQGGITQRGDGASGDFNFNQGYALGEGGHVTVSGEVNKSNATNRTALDQRYDRITYHIGDPDAFETNLAVSAAYPLPRAGAEIYDDLIVARKDSSNTPTFVVPGISPLYPDGYLPKVNPVIWDVGNTMGLRAELPVEIAADLSNTYGYSNANFTDRDTANAALGANSPTEFDAGTARYTLDVTNLNFTRQLSKLLNGANLAAGLEYRYETYAIGSGDPASYLGAGASGFPGFNPRIPVNNSRSAAAAYLDGELQPLAWLSLNAAGRYDHYQDFGGAATWKASARAEATSWLAFRASASTGFRAPSLQQEYYSSITSIANGANKSLVNVGTYQVGDPVAQALGATPLRAEKSHEQSAGIVVRPTPSLSFTADVFRTDIDNRIALSDALSGAAVANILVQSGITNVQQAAFFTNALSTRTQGYDLTARYAAAIAKDTNGSVAVGFEHSPTEILSLAGNPVLPSLALIGVHARTLLTQAQPKDKLTAQFTLDHGPFSGVVDVTHYGEYVDAPILDPQIFGAKTLVDVSFGVRLGQQFTATAGVLNVGNTYPDPLAQQSLAYKSFGGAFLYGEESPFGTDGRAYYLRLQLRL